MDAKLGIKLGANKDVTKEAKNDAIQDAKLGANKGVTKDAKNWAQKWMLKRMEKRCNRWHFTKMYNSAKVSARLFTKIGKKLH